MVARSRGLAATRFSPDGRRLAWIETVGGPVRHRGRPDRRLGAAGGGHRRRPRLAVRRVHLGGRIRPGSGRPNRLRRAGRAAGGRAGRPAGRCGSSPRTGRRPPPPPPPTGGRIAFVLERDDRCDIAVVPTDGSAWPARVSTGADWAFDPAWSPDGRTLAWHEWDFPDMPWDASRIVLRAVDGLAPAGPARVVAGGEDGGVACGQPRFSPDGRRPGLRQRRHRLDERLGRRPRRRRTPSRCSRSRTSTPSRPGARASGPTPGRPTARRWRSAATRAASAGWWWRPLDGEARPIGKGWHHFLDWSAAGIAAIRSGRRDPAVGRDRRSRTAPAPAGSWPRAAPGGAGGRRARRAGAGQLDGRGRRHRPRPALPAGDVGPRPGNGAADDRLRPRRPDRLARRSPGGPATSSGCRGAGRCWRRTTGARPATAGPTRRP